jgi:hypothetical protein
MVLPRPPCRGTSWLADTALIIGTICAARGRGTFHSLRKAAKELNNLVMINPGARRLGLDMGGADEAMAVMVAARPTQARSARRRLRMGPRTMAAITQPSDTRGRRPGGRERARAMAMVTRNSIQISGIPMVPSSSRSGRPSLSCTNRRCRRTRPTSQMRSGRGREVVAPRGTTFPSTASPRRRRRTLRVC